MDLHSLIKNKKLQLKPCKTIITDALGQRYEVTDGVKKHLTRGMPFVVDEKPDLHVARITEGLFLSSQDPAVSIDTLQTYNIRHVLSLGIETSVKFDGITYHHCDLLDVPESDIFPILKTCVKIIHENRHENILVHCNAGVSRSPSIVIAYIMALEELSYDDAYDKVKRARSCIKPNEGFVRQLRTLDVNRLRDLTNITS